MKAHNHVHNIAQKFDVLSESVTTNVPLISLVVKDPMFLRVFALSILATFVNSRYFCTKGVFLERYFLVEFLTDPLVN